MDPEIYYKVYILESPSDIDLLENRSEGKALSEILKISGIPFKYYLVASEVAFENAIEDITEDISELQDEIMFVWPIIHVSCHGCEHGIALTNRAFIKWPKLYSYLADINIYFEEADEVSPIILSMSTCFGLHAIEEDWDEAVQSQFSFVLGHEDEIPWDDALIAFSVFYHHLVSKKATSDIALRCMNDSINRPDYFKLFSSKDFRNYIMGLHNQ